MRTDQSPSVPALSEIPKPIDWGVVARRRGERFLLGSLLGLALALILSGAANIALYKDAECRRINSQARWGAQHPTCFSEVSHWEVGAFARGPAAARDPQSGSLIGWLSIPLTYAFIGGLIGQLPLRSALISGLVLQLLMGGLLAFVAFIAVYVG